MGYTPTGVTFFCLKMSCCNVAAIALTRETIPVARTVAVPMASGLSAIKSCTSGNLEAV